MLRTEYDKGRTKMSAAKTTALLVLIVVAVIVITIITNTRNSTSQVEEIESIINEDLVTQGEAERAEVIVACPEKVAEKYKTTGTDNVIAQDYLVHESDEYPEVMSIKADIIRKQIDYICTEAVDLPEEYISLLGCSEIGATHNYKVYKVLNNHYAPVSDMTEVQQIATDTGLQIRDIYVSLSGQNDADSQGNSENELSTFLVLNDLHTLMTTDDTTSEFATDISGRFTGMFRTNTGMASEDAWQNISAIIDNYKADGIIMAGDMVDFASSTNYELFQMGLNKIQTPILYTRADHDVSAWYNSDGSYTNEDAQVAHNSFTSAGGNVSNDEILVWEFDEYIILGWNNSCFQMSSSALEKAREIFAKNKPIILVTHVPLDTGDDGLYESSIAAYDGVHAKLWGDRNCYYQPDDNTRQFINMCLDKNSQVRSIICGHLHYQYDAPVHDDVMEYVLAPSFQGSMCRLHILK